MPHLVARSGIAWHYDIEGEGPALLFIHGWGVDRRVWRQQSKYFSQYYKVMTVDLPGHGKSGWETIGLEGMVVDLKLIFERARFSRVTVVGSSLGGLVALKFYELYPQGVERMVFVGSMPKFSKSEGYPHGLDIAQLRKLGGQLDSHYPSIVNIFFRSLFTKEERQTRRFKWIQKFRQNEQAPMKPALAEYLDILEKEDLRDVLKAARVPMQFITGKGDEICTAETVVLLKTLAPHSRYDFFEGCGHFPFVSKPREFNRVLEDFLGRSSPLQ
jgi:pimeloyl-[acyl-carrier protein] methyl ester esterase